MKYADLREFISQLEARGELKRIEAEVSPRLEMTEICDRVLRSGGPALLFERPKGHDIPVPVPGDREVLIDSLDVLRDFIALREREQCSQQFDGQRLIRHALLYFVETEHARAK